MGEGKVGFASKNVKAKKSFNKLKLVMEEKRAQVLKEYDLNVRQEITRIILEYGGGVGGGRGGGTRGDNLPHSPYDNNSLGNYCTYDGIQKIIKKSV